MLKLIGEALGLKVGVSKAQLSDAEKWVDAGYMPGVGPVNTREFQDLPITVREMVVELQRKGKHNA